MKKVYHGTYIYNGVVDHYLKKVMLVILVLLSMMAGGHQQSCLRSLIRHRPHKYWHRFGLTHTYTLCKSETHMKALCTCGGRQPKRESISLQTVHISLLYFFTAIIHCIVPYTPIYEPGQISNWGTNISNKDPSKIFNHYYHQQQQQAHTQHRSPPWGCQHTIFRVKSPLTSPSTPHQPTQSENLEMMMQENVKPFCKG